jgi:hypothetical protein
MRSLQLSTEKISWPIKMERTGSQVSVGSENLLFDVTKKQVVSKISPETTLQDTLVYLVRMDTEQVRKGKQVGEICYVEDEEVAKHIVESLANEQVKLIRESNASLKVYRENMDDPTPYLKRIDIFKVDVGIVYNSGLQKIASIGYVRVPRATYTDPLLSKK